MTLNGCLTWLQALGFMDAFAAHLSSQAIVDRFGNPKTGAKAKLSVEGEAMKGLCEALPSHWSLGVERPQGP